MKPVIIYTDTYDEKNNTLTINKDKFESIIDQVYQSGVEDGKKNNCIINYPSGVRGFYPDWTVRPSDMPTYETGKPQINDTTIIC